ncbi:uncharacterized protein AB675_10901 [Cyphellophora attinorum]|uniref:PRISE-like Rossmann-fold domain-containing protein n=1 Tax=Cyphellophora attinorum TaxID=1664694 RepID=A0A0N0NN00_9EURO|nr:uncharacterized protein AB675_10901 [Phialophora attinorum]KPI40938.1 hypothetical protein AB675_10901 [Phialophora attinorum]
MTQHIKGLSAAGKVAFVTGVNGISGNAMVEYLIRQPEREWSKIVISSRSSLKVKWQDHRIEFLALDFLRPVEELIQSMKQSCSDVTHAYFMSYVHVDDFTKLAGLNVPLFSNFLHSIDQVSGQNLQRVSLQTGGKHYGCHLGPCPAPMHESHPRYNDQGQNFYFNQQDELVALSKQRSWGWNVIRPNAVIGCTPGRNGMSEALTMALYLLVCRETGEQVKFPGGAFIYDSPDDNSDSQGLSEITAWSSTALHTKNEAFNYVNGDTFVWRYFLPEIGKYYGMDIGTNLELNLNLAEWAKDKEPIWQKICDKYGGDREAFSWATWYLMDWLGQRTWCTLASMTKAREFGWTRHDDTVQSWYRTFKSLENEGILPRIGHSNSV